MNYDIENAIFCDLNYNSSKNSKKKFKFQKYELI